MTSARVRPVYLFGFGPSPEVSAGTEVTCSSVFHALEGDVKYRALYLVLRDPTAWTVLQIRVNQVEMLALPIPGPVFSDLWLPRMAAFPLLRIADIVELDVRANEKRRFQALIQIEAVS